MSVLDAFFNKGFKAVKCKTLLKLTIPRIKLLRNKRENQLKQMRRDIAKLLENGQEATARIRVEHIIREENMMAAQEIIELFCELIAVRLPIIETQRECPLDLKEAISSVCFAAPRCSDLPELQQVQMLFAAKYGREFIAAASELLPDCGVNRQIIELLSVRAPSVEARLKLLKEIAEEHGVEWDPAASETEFLKPHEDLLNGPSHSINDPALPLAQEKQEESTSSKSNHHEVGEEAESDENLDSLNLPEVPKASVRATSETSPWATDSGHVRFEPSKYTTDEFGNPNMTSLTMKEIKHLQYVPFVAPPPPPPFSSPVEKHHAQVSTDLSVPVEKTDPTPDFRSSLDNGDPFCRNFSMASEKDDTASLSHVVPKQSESGKGGGTNNVDLEDVLAAAQAAADSADQAAQAARAAASLAQVRIAEIVRKQNLNSTREEKETNVPGDPTFEYNHLTNCDDTKDYMHQPQRSVSLEDDPYFSYPNLFSGQNSQVIKHGDDSPNEHSSFSR